jgi:hypothetical protein
VERREGSDTRGFFLLGEDWEKSWGGGISFFFLSFLRKGGEREERMGKRTKKGDAT